MNNTHHPDTLTLSRFLFVDDLRLMLQVLARRIRRRTIRVSRLSQEWRAEQARESGIRH
jgi:hypothetical protein